MSTPAPAARRDGADGSGIASRAVQVVMAVVVAVVSVMLMVPIHRVVLVAGGVHWPVGLVLGALFQLAASVFLFASTGRRLPVLVLLIVWGVLAMSFAGNGAGGGVLMPGAVAGVPQYSGYVLQGVGIGIPLIVLVVLQVLAVRRAAAGPPSPRR